MTLEEIEKRLRVLEDIEEIKQLHYAYHNAVMLCDWDGAADCFFDGSVVDFEGAEILKGKEEIYRDMKERISRVHIGKEGIFSLHPVIKVDGDNARAEWFYYNFLCHPRGPADSSDQDKAPDWVQGVYNMEYRRVDGKWKISLLQWKSRLVSKRK